MTDSTRRYRTGVAMDERERRALLDGAFKLAFGYEVSDEEQAAVDRVAEWAARKKS